MDSYSKLLELVNTSGCFAPANHMYVTELRPDHSAVGVLEVQPSSPQPHRHRPRRGAGHTGGHRLRHGGLHHRAHVRHPGLLHAVSGPGVRSAHHLHGHAQEAGQNRPGVRGRAHRRHGPGRWPPGFIPFSPRGRQTDPHPQQARRRARLLYFRSPPPRHPGCPAGRPAAAGRRERQTGRPTGWCTPTAGPPASRPGRSPRSVLRARQRKKPSAPTTRAEALRRMGNTRGRAAAPSASPWRVLHSPSPLYAHPPVGEQHRQYDQQQKQQGFIPS